MRERASALHPVTIGVVYFRAKARMLEAFVTQAQVHTQRQIAPVRTQVDVLGPIKSLCAAFGVRERASIFFKAQRLIRGARTTLGRCQEWQQ